MTCNIAVHTCQDWAQSGGDWGKSAIYQNLTRTEKQRRRGRFKKMTRDQLLAKYADTELVAQLISRKESEHLAFDHPDFPGRGTSMASVPQHVPVKRSCYNINHVPTHLLSLMHAPLVRQPEHAVVQVLGQRGVRG